MPNNRSEESHRRTDGYILLTSVVGYFADAQYDVFFAFPEGGSVLLSLRGSEATKQSPGRVEVYGVYAPRFFGGSAAVCFRVAEYKTHKICKNLKKVVKQLIFLSKHYIMYTDN